MNIYLTTAWFV